MSLEHSRHWCLKGKLSWPVLLWFWPLILWRCNNKLMYSPFTLRVIIYILNIIICLNLFELPRVHSLVYPNQTTVSKLLISPFLWRHRRNTFFCYSSKTINWYTPLLNPFKFSNIVKDNVSLSGNQGTYANGAVAMDTNSTCSATKLFASSYLPYLIHRHHPVRK